MAFESIDREECIGDSLTKINSNAQNFDGRISTLEGDSSNLQSSVTQINNRIDNIFSRGMIMMWSGTLANIPEGWALCNGQNNTPDLRNRFIVGAGNTYQVGNTGGVDTVRLNVDQIPAHTHNGLTLPVADHAHTIYYVDVAPGGQGVYRDEQWHFDTIRKKDQRTTYQTTSPSGAHSHAYTTNSTGGNQFHENRPPYYALAFIMKL